MLKSIYCLEGKSMTQHWENTFFLRSSQQLPSLGLGPLKSGTLGVEVPRSLQEQLTQTLSVRLLKAHLFSLFHEL